MYSHIKKTLTIVLLTIASSGISNPVFAWVVNGISPGVMRVDIESGTEIEKKFTLSRDNPESDMLVEIEIGGDGKSLVDIGAKHRITLPKGERQATFPFKVVTNSMLPGQYEATMTFLNPVPKKIDGPFAIRSGVTGRVAITIVEKGKLPIKPISVTENTEALSHVHLTASSLSDKWKRLFTETQLRLHIDNTGSVPLKDIPYTISLSRNGQVLGELKRSVGDSIDSHTSHEVVVPIPAISFGVLTVTVTMGNDRFTHTLFVLPWLHVWMIYALTLLFSSMTVMLSWVAAGLLTKNRRKRYVNTGVLCVVFFCVYALVYMTIWFVRVPKIHPIPTDTVEHIRSDVDAFLVFSEPSELEIHKITIVSVATQEKMHIPPGWSVATVPKGEHLFLFPPESESVGAVSAVKEGDVPLDKQFWYMVNSTGIYPAKRSLLPARVQQIALDPSGNYVAIRGQNASSESVVCLVSPPTKGNDDCMSITRYLPQKSIIQSVTWNQQDEPTLAIHTSGGTFFYSVWEKSIKPSVDSKFVTNKSITGEQIGQAPILSWLLNLYHVGDGWVRIPKGYDTAYSPMGHLMLITTQNDGWSRYAFVRTDTWQYEMLPPVPPIAQLLFLPNSGDVITP